MRKILENLREVQNAVKEDPVLNKKVLEATEAYIKNSTTLTKLLTLMKTFDFSSLKSLTKSLKVDVDAPHLWPGLLRRLLPQAVCQQQHLLSLGVQQLLRGRILLTLPMNNILLTPRGEKADMDTDEIVEKEPSKELEKEKAEEEPARAS
ncbi:hypothetical protein Tco_0526271 [Tanacetum coccineum]